MKMPKCFKVDRMITEIELNRWMPELENLVAGSTKLVCFYLFRAQIQKCS